jgi:Fe-S cluster assembly iron-binding protein IscA
MQNVDCVEQGIADYDGVRVTRDTRATRYHSVVSLVFVSFRFSSRLHVVGHTSGLGKGILFSLPSLILGWWGIPWGIVWTVTSVLSNLTGGETQSVGELVDKLIGHRRHVVEFTARAGERLRAMIQESHFPPITAVRVIPDPERGQRCQIQFDVPESDGRQWIWFSQGLDILVDKNDSLALSGKVVDYQDGEFVLRRGKAAADGSAD